MSFMQFLREFSVVIGKESVDDLFIEWAGIMDKIKEVGMLEASSRPTLKRLLDERRPDSLKSVEGELSYCRYVHVKENMRVKGINLVCFCFTDYDDFNSLLILMKLLYPRGARKGWLFHHVKVSNYTGVHRFRVIPQTNHKFPIDTCISIFALMIQNMKLGTKLYRGNFVCYQ